MFISNGIAYAGTRAEDIDIAPETMYENSYAYEDMRA